MQRFTLQPVDDEGPVFSAPWEAQAFGLVIALHEQGLFNWDEWARQLSQQISLAQAEGDPDLGDTYYQHWLRALEQLLELKGLANYQEIGDVAALWREAYLHTPHGMPVELPSVE
ncbi:MAG: nitrile hydratase accessory protein [Proteobacteria bacterium]|nr:nitrile hydratase accessory protein [Pseudomonadota bacterium]